MRIILVCPSITIQTDVYRLGSKAPLSTPGTPAAAENRPSQPSSPAPPTDHQEPEVGEAPPAATDLDIHDGQTTIDQGGAIDETNTTRSVVQNGVFIIEELDSPAIRREKNMRRKAEKLRAAKEAAQSATDAPPTTASPVAGPSSLSADPANVLDSDLSSLSESDADDSRRDSRTLESKVTRPRASNAGAVKFPLEGGTLGTSNSCLVDYTSA